MNTPPLEPISSQPFEESMKATAKRIRADLEHGIYLTRLVQTTDKTSEERQFLIELGTLCEKASRDVQDALRGF